MKRSELKQGTGSERRMSKRITRCRVKTTETSLKDRATTNSNTQSRRFSRLKTSENEPQPTVLSNKRKPPQDLRSTKRRRRFYADQPPSKITRSHTCHIHDLPNEILCHIFQYALSDNTTAIRRSMMKVCSLWNGILRHPSWWISLSLEYEWIKDGFKYMKNLHGCGLLTNLKSLTVCDRYKYQRNVRTRRKELVQNLTSDSADAFLDWIGETYPNIEEIALRRANITEKAVTVLNTSFKTLKRIDLTNSKLIHVRWKKLIDNLMSRKYREKLVLHSVWTSSTLHVPHNWVESAWMQKLPCLTFLDLSSNHLPCFKKLMKSLPKVLKVLKLDQSVIWDSITTRTAGDGALGDEIRLPYLEFFSANHLTVSGNCQLVQVSRFLHHSPKLKVLGLERWMSQFLVDLDKLELPLLEEFTFSVCTPEGTDVEPDVQILLPQTRNLKKLVIAENKLEANFFYRLLDSLQSVKVKHVGAAFSSLTLSHLKLLLTKSPQLEYLNVRGCENVLTSRQLVYHTPKDIQILRKWLSYREVEIRDL